MSVGPGSPAEGSPSDQGRVAEQGRSRSRRTADAEYRAAADFSYKLRAVVRAWKEQQAADRAMRRRYAHSLLWLMAAQILAVNVAFFLLGFKLMAVEEWTARAFILAVFAEVGALVLVVTKYLFPPPSDKVLEVIDRLERRKAPAVEG